MSIKNIIIFCVFFGVPISIESWDSSVVVSDLLPEDCFLQEWNYKETDDLYGLPQCFYEKSPKDPCNKYHLHKDYKDVVYKPTSCTKDGKFGPKQCKGDRTTGRCFCFDENGHRLFGEQWWSQADNMTCACSRKKAEMSNVDPKSPNYVFFNSLHCNSVGNYESLQCDVVSEQCWCADEKTGDLTSPVVPQVAMAKLPCYSSLTVGSQYLRQCENEKYALKNIEHQLSLRGTVATYGDILCGEDGSYGAFTVVDGLAYCTWRDNSKIGSWSSGNPDPSTLNCNCARDSKIFSEAGKSQKQSCGPTGNYQSLQGTGTSKYCVDSDGYRKSEMGCGDKCNKDEDCETYKSYVDAKS